MNRQQTVNRVLWLQQLAAAATDEAALLRDELEQEARAEYKAHGTRVTYSIPDVATVAANLSKRQVYVSDYASFAKWVAERFPTEVESVIEVRGSWQAAFLASLLDDDGTVFTVDGEPVPGVSVRAGGAFKHISIRPTDAANAVMRAAAEHALRRIVAEEGPDQPAVLAELSDATA